jgi:hypothetical protein
MTEIYSIDKIEREILFPLFKENQYDTVVMKSVLEGDSGHAYSDSKTNPTVCRLDSGAYTIFGGNPNSIAAIELVRQSPINVVTPENKTWENLLYNEFKERISYQPFYKFLPYSLNKEHLLQLAINIDDDYKVLRIDRDLANQLPIDINNNYFFEHFCSSDDFLTRGIGFCVKYNNRIVSAITSMAASEKMINIEIETHSGFRNKNLGTAVSAKLLLYCLENDIEAHWLAATDISEKLALKLGYVKDEFYKTFLIR